MTDEMIGCSLRISAGDSEVERLQDAKVMALNFLLFFSYGLLVIENWHIRTEPDQFTPNFACKTSCFCQPLRLQKIWFKKFMFSNRLAKPYVERLK